MNWKEIVKEMLQNYPEYSTEYLRCIKYDYDNNHYEFKILNPADQHTYITRKLDIDIAAFAANWFAHQHVDGNLNYIGYEYNDVGTYDADVVDAIVQKALLGDIVYG